ncbi:hypothetical protein PFICI_14625 [Pestalotiopsis fici W106-1]|uniref:Uncharacterized protein n=1 Tax=Pestalotiopsis fici (strain W106-1 / CGMCC3.15140) TaxID=1229662 RepID=W3WIR9_PESFW|nr:uncharacterized protein PFICI_14625 [Pestalotiopsis fici W106-1]ETS73679.1 hypothetical protein PFICI_14625 [Pestalotiopsis fici W106-1]
MLRESSRLRAGKFKTTALQLLAVFFCISLLLYCGIDTNPPPHQSSSPSLQKALVIASSIATSQDTAWLSQVPRDWAIYHYVTDEIGSFSPSSSTALSVPADKGNEAMAYLTYIIDHYDELPDVIFFRHSHHKSWHQAFDSVFEVSSLRAEYVLERGYVSPRCMGGCENVMPVADEGVSLADIHLVTRDAQLRSLLSEFLDPAESIPSKIAAPCCAQFAVSRVAVQSRSREWWQALRSWLISTSLSSYSSGRLLEWTWHIWFGEEASL